MGTGRLENRGQQFIPLHIPHTKSAFPIITDIVSPIKIGLSSVVLFTIIPISEIIAEIYGAKNFPSKQPKMIVVIGRSIISNFVFPAICFEISSPKITEK